MATLVSETPGEAWRRRLFLPNYQIGDAARYARISPQTVAAWHRRADHRERTLSEKEKRKALSYMQLIEVAVVAAFRKAGVPLNNIRAAREYVSSQFQSEFPFAEYRFKTDGKRVLMDYDQFEGERAKEHLLRPDQGGQLAWKSIMGRLREFEYENGGVAVRWHVAGPKSPIVIDPRLSFGAPTVKGTPTWAIKGRYVAGESIADIADDFELDISHVRDALMFEGITPDRNRPNVWVN